MKKAEKIPLRLFNPKLKGHAHTECTVPGCSSTMRSTGFLCYHGEGISAWYMEFECPEHGIQLSCGGKWQALINEVMEEELSR